MRLRLLGILSGKIRPPQELCILRRLFLFCKNWPLPFNTEGKMKNRFFEKITSLLLAVIMAFGMFPMTVFAADPVITAAADKTEAAIGDTVEVAFEIAGNPGFTNIELTLDFNKAVLKFTGLKINPDTESYEGRFGGGATVANTDPESAKYGFVTNARSSATTTDGKLFVAQFEVIGFGETAIGANISLMENSGEAVGVMPAVTPSDIITVAAPEEGMLSLDRESLALKTGQSYAFSVKIEEGSATGETVTWASDNESVAFVDEGGKVTALSVGEAVITAQCGSLSAFCTVTVSEPVPYLDSLYLSEASFVNSAGTAYEYTMEPAFGEKIYEYTAVAQDTYTRAFAWASLSENAPEGSVITAKWTDTNGIERTAEIPSDKSTGTFLTNAVAAGIGGNTVYFEVGADYDILTYTVEIKRSPSLSGLSAADEKGENIRFNESFGADITEYSASTAAKEITVSAVPFDESYSVTYNGSESNIVALAEGENTIAIEVKNGEGYSKIYNLNINRIGTAKVKFDVSPENALVFITDKFSRRVWPDENGEFELLAGESYSYSVTALGYVGKAAEYIPAEDETVVINLRKAEETEFVKYESTWPSFGFSSENNIVIDRPTPLTKDETALYWANKIGEGFDYGATGVPILVDDYLFCYAGKNIMKIDKMSGEIVQTGIMTGGSSAYAICSLTYAEGLVFVGLNNGTVQAFNAETLESIWIYRDALKGQPNAQITYSDGYVYTGFWSAEDGDANYVCLSITDEDPNSTEEEKTATWTHTQKGGFYWAGAYIEGDYLYLGTDDGKAESLHGDSHFLSINKHTGEVIEDVAIPNGGDIRSSVTHSDGKLYFTSKGGFFHEAEYDPSTGDIINIRSLKLDNGGEGGVPMSTSTPTVYNGRAYVGVSGRGQFVPYSGHGINVIDIESWEVAYRVPTQGYPQTTGTLTTYYEDESGFVYVYFFDNYTPGKLRVIADKPGLTEPLLTIEETSNGVTYTVGYSVFEPTGSLAQYCICTPIIDEDGTLYFKNDSAYLFAVGSAVEYIEVTKNPDKMSYKPGEVFDPAGMEVTAYYYNGTERDITDYVTYSTEPLTEADENFMIVYENVGSDEKPYDVINLSVTSGFVELTPEKQNTAVKIRLNDTIKLDNSIDTPETFFADKPAGGNFYVGIFSDIEYDSIEIHADGYLKAQMIDFDPERYRSVGETYSVYNRITGEIAEKGKSITYDRAKKLAQQLNEKTKTTYYEVRCDQYVYIAKITVGKNYGTAFESGTYKITAEKDGVKYSSAEYTVVTDVSIFEYEYLKWSAMDKENAAGVMDENARGYSDYLSYKYGYGDWDYAPPLMKEPTVVSTTAFRAVAGRELRLACGERVRITITEVSDIQKGVNFIYKNSAGEIDSEKKTASYTLTFYGEQPIQSDFVIEWNLGVNLYELRESFKIKVEEEDIITYYITKNGKYFDEFTVDYMTADMGEEVVLSLENNGGTTLGTYRITTQRPADADSAAAGREETNPETGAPVF
ncbi:MAG: Ig-like domain-containing protein [Oscillospiraceae bacterium]|nr:Ig-like domain-containing protein [Oscillospiraceae bacterium]